MVIQILSLAEVEQDPLSGFRLQVRHAGETFSIQTKKLLIATGNDRRTLDRCRDRLDDVRVESDRRQAAERSARESEELYRATFEQAAERAGFGRYARFTLYTGTIDSRNRRATSSREVDVTDG